MVATQFLDYLSKLQVSTYVGVEDFADKFNFLFTVIVLLLSAMVVTVKQYMMKPISCYAATDVGGKNLMDYVENYCWVQGTIPNNFNVPLPETPEEWAAFEEKKILYYQWVPFVLGLQCILFYLPRVIWQLFCYNRTGTDIQHIVYTANQAVHSDTESRNKMVLHLAKTLEQMLFQHREYRSGSCVQWRLFFNRYCCLFTMSKRLGTCITLAYMFVKLMYACNAIGQVYFMYAFLGSPNVTSGVNFGLHLLHNIMDGRDWRSSQIFPRVSFCYVELKQLGRVSNSMVAQCVLPVNMLNEKIYIFLWFWISIVAVVTVISIPVWMVRLTYYSSRTFVLRFLKLSNDIRPTKDEPHHNYLVDRFVEHFLRRDGVFLLRIILLNVGDVLTGELISLLWQTFRKKYTHTDFLCGNENRGVIYCADTGEAKNPNKEASPFVKSKKPDRHRSPTAPPAIFANRYTFNTPNSRHFLDGEDCHLV